MKTESDTTDVSILHYDGPRTGIERVIVTAEQFIAEQLPITAIRLGSIHQMAETLWGAPTLLAAHKTKCTGNRPAELLFSAYWLLPKGNVSRQSVQQVTTQRIPGIA